MPFVVHRHKTEKHLNQIFFYKKLTINRVDEIVFVPEREEEIKTSFWHIWIAQWLKFFRTTAYFFDFGQEEKMGQSWTKSANFGSLPFP